MYTLPTLNYQYGDLEPHIDAKTMEIHHTKHHQTYINNLNEALAKYPEFGAKSVEDLLRDIDNVPPEIKTAVINNGGGHANHTFFWEILSPKESPLSDELQTAISDMWGNFDTFKEQFVKTAMSRFGSGWAWLVKNKEGKLELYSTPNQDSPLMENKTPILGLDVWEHAYYLNYQNKRADYVQAFWNIINWEEVSRRFNS